MHNITLISTMHKEMGRCNADELHAIIEKISPEVIFLEALEGTYSDYDHSRFKLFGVYDKKLEINAIQKYCATTSFKYIPVLDNELPDAFVKKCHIVSEYEEFRRLLDYFNSLAEEYGFEFLNSPESVTLNDEMRMLENRILNDNELNKAAIDGIDAYENSMIQNIYSYCDNNEFNTAIFMCGVAHRKSIIEKIEKFKAQEETNINWLFFQTDAAIPA